MARHGPGLVLFARQWTRSTADAEDAVQEGFVSFWRNRGHARDGAAYLYASVRTAAIDLVRGRHRRERREAGIEIDPASGFAVGHAELAGMVEAALAKLVVEQREVIVMKLWGGLTFAEIGDALGVSLNTAASRYRYGLERLEKELAAEVACE
jgi:RNA polymerase sigma-70 factor (ECF subfamily)